MQSLWLLLAALAFGALLLVCKALAALPHTELRRRARSGHDASLYHLASLGRRGYSTLVGLDVFLLAIFLHHYHAWWQIFISLSVVSWAIFFWRGPLPGGSAWNLANIFADWLGKALAWLPASADHHTHGHTRIYDKDDLLEMLDHQSRQVDSRIAEHDLQVAARALKFSGRKVGDVMTPLAKAKLVASADDIGPHLLDELHAMHDSGFLVVKDGGAKNSPEPIGVLYLDDALEHAEGGKVKDAMTHGIETVDEDASLLAALTCFVTKKQHFLAVTNNFEELVGTLSLQRTLEQIFGTPKREQKIPQ
jgi:CBS domain-containing protein